MARLRESRPSGRGGASVSNGAAAFDHVDSEVVEVASPYGETDDAAIRHGLIEAVVGRVIKGFAGTFDVGDAVTADRFAQGISGVEGTAFVGLLHHRGARGPAQGLPARVRLTPSDPGANGLVEIAVFQRLFRPPDWIEARPTPPPQNGTPPPGPGL